MKKRHYSIVCIALLAIVTAALFCGQSFAFAEHTHDFSSGRCGCGAVKIEAEAGVASGTPQVNSSTGIASFLENELYTASGGLCIGYWGGYSDNKLAVGFTLSDDVAEARIEISLAESVKNISDAVAPDVTTALDSYDDQNWTFKFLVNGKYYGFEKGDIPANDGSYENWGTIVSYPLPLKKGANSISVEALNSNQYNFDYFVVNVPADVTAEYSEVDTEQPLVDVVTISPYNPYAGESIKISFSATDNQTAESDLTVSTKVYFNYKKAGSRVYKLDENDCFVPTKVGKYTVIVTVTDEAGNTATRTRVFDVKQGEWKEPVPLPPKEPMDTGVVVGIISLCVAFGGAAIATVVTLLVRKRGSLAQ